MIRAVIVAIIVDLVCIFVCICANWGCKRRAEDQCKDEDEENISCLE